MATFTWTEEIEAELESLYLSKLNELQEADPEQDLSAFSAEALTFAAGEIGNSVPSSRMKLSRKGVYVKQKQKASAPKAGASSEGTKRVGKAEAQGELIAAFKDGGVEDLDADIVEKLTGKAAMYLASKVREVLTNQ